MSVALLALVALRAEVQPVADVPFQMTGGRVYVETETRGKREWMIVDSGAGVSLLDSQFAKSLGAETSGTIPVGGAGESAQKGDLLKNVEIQLVGGPVKVGAFMAIPLTPLEVYEGRPMRGILGSNLFGSYIVELDYPAKRMRLYSPDGFRYSGTAKPIPLTFANLLPQIETTVDFPQLPDQKMRTMLDTGASGAVSVTAAFDAKMGLEAKLPPGPLAPIAGGVGGLTKGRYFRFGRLQIGDSSLKQPVASLTSSAGGALGRNANYDCLIGAEVLRRYRITFNYRGKNVYFEPTSAVKEEFPVDQTGMLLMSANESLRGVRVYEVVAESSAAQAGVQKDDILVSIDGKAVDAMTLDEVRRGFRKAGKPWKLVLQRGTERVEVEVRPRPLA